ncbi:galectin-4-like [Saccostrea echinata]|uniref:galectin-4-like n=1 Tax=Saccostrea echinata TaxID=191078 RepID=UPI002A81FDC7|nr:galectin-4-like [Saccostrea echinata]
MQTIGRIDYPVIPFEGDIPGGLQPGKQIFVQGDFSQIPGSDYSFGINFKCGRGQGTDIAFHFNPRVSQKCVVRNTLRNGAWEQEERGGPMPFGVGQQFEIIFAVDQYQFKVAVNGQHFTEFRHRIPVERINTLQISGAVSIKVIRFDSPYTGPPTVPFPSPQNIGFGIAPPAGFMPPPYTAGCVPQPQCWGCTPPQPPSSGNSPVSYPPAYPSQPQDPIYNPAIPFMGYIPPSGMTPGKLIHITGVTGPNRFSVNIQDNAGGSCDIAFHFDVRINLGNQVNEIVRNSKTNDQWGPEETQKPYFPFQPNTNFDMMILCEPQCFKVAVDGKHFIEFKHRLQPLDRFRFLGIVGDVKVTQIRIQ